MAMAEVALKAGSVVLSAVSASSAEKAWRMYLVPLRVQRDYLHAKVVESSGTFLRTSPTRRYFWSNVGTKPMDGLEFLIWLVPAHAFVAGRYHDTAALMEYDYATLKVLDLPYWEREVRLGRLAKDAETGLWLLGSMRMPKLWQLDLRPLETIAAMHLARVGLAAKRFKETKGKWPAGVGHLSEVKKGERLDPFTGEELRIVKAKQGIRIYSVGPDRTDDGGQRTTGRGSKRKGDIVWAMR